MKYPTMEWGTMEAVINKLGGMNGVRRFLSGELTLNIPQFAVWKTVKIGVHKQLDILISALSKFRLSDWAKDVLGKPAFMLAQTEEDIDLCVASVKELTGKNQATTTEIFDAIKRVGDLCPAEVGPALREQYTDQPKGEWLRIAMEPINDSADAPRVFRVEHDDVELWLNAYYAKPDYVWAGVYRFVFRARK